MVINEMRAIKENIPSKALKILTNKLVSKYSDIFEDMDEDEVILGDGSIFASQYLSIALYLQSFMKELHILIDPIKESRA